MNTIIKYNGNTIATISGTGTKTLNCSDKYMSGNIEVVGISSTNLPLTFTANTAGSTVTLTQYGTAPWSGYYSTDYGTTWTAYTLGTTITLTNVGSSVSFKGTTSANQDTENYIYFSMTGSISSLGNIMSLCSGNNFASATAIPYDYCFYQLFERCTSLVSAPELPATTLTTRCYFAMFYMCSGLIASPELSATTLTAGCYLDMFYGCTSLTTIPALPATTLTNQCYKLMFVSCTALKFSETQTSDCPNEFRIPSGTATGTTATDWNTNMIKSTSGSFTSNPVINTTYYTNATVI